MSSLGGGNGDGWPPDGGGQSDGLPGLPPEWGSVVIPDDPAELAEEAAAVRRELRREARRATWRRRFGLPPRAGTDDSQPSLGLPLLIMSIAVVATLTSLFAVAWPGRTTHPIAATNSSAQQTAATTPTTPKLPDLALTDATGTAVKLRDLIPAALLLVDGCQCAELVLATAAAAPQAVRVVAIGRTVPTVSSTAATPTGARKPGNVTTLPGAASSPSAIGLSGQLRLLADPADALRSALGLDPPGAHAVVLLISETGDILRTVSNVDSIEDYRTELAQLTKG